MGKNFEQSESTKEINKLIYDDIFYNAAPKAVALETIESRLERYVEQENNNLDKMNLNQNFLELDQSDELFMIGNENESINNYGKDLLNTGYDHASCEARNNQWIRESFLAKEEYKSNKILWVVGANHLAGLLVNFEKLGANIASVSFESVQNSVSG